MEESTQHPTEPIAVIDIGSNSICMLVAMILHDGSIAPVAKHKDSARLRDEVGEDGRLSPLGEARATAVLLSFAKHLQNWGVVRSRVVATAALRAATNGPEVVQRIAAATGLNLEIIEGVEEARLAWRGVLGGMARRIQGTVLCADVGGGSTELLVSHGGEILHAVSLPLGALVVTRRWLGADPVEPGAVALARAEVRAALDLALEGIGRPHIDHAIASSGSIQRVARIRQAMHAQSVDAIHGLDLSRADLSRVTAALEAAPLNEERLAIPGMDPSRSDILLGGAIIYEELLDLLHAPGWSVSMDGLRMGVLRELADQAEVAVGALPLR